MKKLFNLQLTSLLLLVNCVISAAYGGIISTFGDLTSDSDGSVITDLVSGREYLRLDQLSLNGFTRSQTSISIGAGGIFEGWSIANAQINDDFISALFGRSSNPCVETGVVQSYGQTCGHLVNWADGAFGNSYFNWDDYWVFIDNWSDPFGTLEGVGYIQTAASNGGGNVREASPWAVVNTNVYDSINYLLYRDQTVSNPSTGVPEPASLAIFAFGLVGLVARRWFKQS